jgi:hypothetical protein
MLFLDGVYVECGDVALRFRWVKAPTCAELTRLAHTIARTPVVGGHVAPGEQLQPLLHQGMTGAALEIDQHPDAAGRVRPVKQGMGELRLRHAARDLLGFPWRNGGNTTLFTVSLVHAGRSVNPVGRSPGTANG